MCLRCQYTLPMSFQLSVGHLLDTTVIACVCGRVCLRCHYTLPMSFQLSVGHLLDTTVIACVCGVPSVSSLSIYIAHVIPAERRTSLGHLWHRVCLRPSVPSLSLYIAHVIPAERRTSLGHHWHRVCLRCAECAFVVTIHCPCHSS